MENIESLRNIAEYLGLKSIVSEIEAIDLRAKQENASLIFFEEKEELLIPNWGCYSSTFGREYASTWKAAVTAVRHRRCRRVVLLLIHGFTLRASPAVKHGVSPLGTMSERSDCSIHL